MKTIRRLYFYLVAFISMEVVLWGLIGLARSLFSDVIGGTSALAQALAMILVGITVFGIHWWAAQRSAHTDADEHASGVRAFFLYAVLFALFMPIAQSVWALLNRLLLELFNLSVSRALLGGGQKLSDNLTSIIMNGAIGTYFLLIVRSDWAKIKEKASLRLTQRIYRYLWVLYALAMSVGGMQQVLRYLLSRIATSATGLAQSEWLMNGLALLLVGIPIWVWAWKVVQDAVDEEGERNSLLRLGILYFLSLAGVVVVLSSAGVIAKALLDLIFGNNASFSDLMRDIRTPLAIGIPLGAVWAYYGHWLKRDLAAVPDAPRRASMNRLYAYILALIGLVATFSGVAILLSFFIDLTRGTTLLAGSTSGTLAGSLATLIVGMPLWLRTWRPMQAEALADNEAGEHARRSLTRKLYLYIAIFAGVVGGMIAAVRLISLLFEALLASPARYFISDTFDALEMLALFAALLSYHWKTLQTDGTRLSATLDAKRTEFNVLYLAQNDDPLALQLASAIGKESQRINFIVQPQPETESTIHALLLPEDVALTADKKLGAWMRKFTGSKFIVQHETSEWLWLRDPELIAKSLSQLAEGEPIQLTKKAHGWMIAVYILAGLMAFEILFFMFALVMSSFGM